MQLKAIDDQLSLGSVFKLFVVGWAVAWGAFGGLIVVLLFAVALISGQMAVNGEIIEGRGAALVAMAPIAIVFPLVVVIQAFMFGAFLTGGIWLYRLRRPLRVISERSTT